MSKSRVSKPAKVAKSLEEIEGVMSQLAKDDARLQKINASMDEAITAIRKKNEAEIASLTASIETGHEDLETFATANKDLFKTSKTKDFPHGSIGYRTGTPKVKQLRKLTLQQVLELCKKKLKPYVRVKEELDKQKLIADRDNKDVKKHLDYCGIEIVQEETFFVDLKKEGE
jgi:phage host-nuclease inhibitor protein Gam